VTREEYEANSSLYEEATAMYEAAKGEFEGLKRIIGEQLGHGQAVRVNFRKKFDSAREWERLTADYLAARDHFEKVTGAWADRLGGRLTSAEHLVESQAREGVAAARRDLEDFRRNHPGVAQDPDAIRPTSHNK
jgi:hypothetical protein